MSEDAKNMIKKTAWKFFPAQELWINNDDEFWAFEKHLSEVHITIGEYKNKTITYSTMIESTDNVDHLVDCLTKEKTKQGYECFAIELLS